MNRNEAALDFVRFMRLVTFSKDPAGCWRFGSENNPNQYRNFTLSASEEVKAHRWIYELVVGPITDGLIVRHKCDNPSCVNPAHLEVGTHADNTRDKFERGRGPDRRGDKHPMARVTPEDVLEIRRKWSCGSTQPELARQYDLSRQHIGKIVRRESWGHL